MRSGAADQALPRLQWVLSVARESGDRWGQAAALHVLGQLHLAEGDLTKAQECLDTAMSIWATMDIPLWQARTESNLARLALARGDTQAAAAAFASASTVFHERGAREYHELAAEMAQLP